MQIELLKKILTNARTQKRPTLRQLADKAAEKARDAVNHLFALRPCDYAFEPDPELALGLGCLFAQVRSCAAPCLARTSEEDYRALAGRAAAWLAVPAKRSDAPASVPASVARVQGARAVVLGVGRKAVGLYPVREGRVLEAAALTAEPDQIDAAAARLEGQLANAAALVDAAYPGGGFLSREDRLVAVDHAASAIQAGASEQILVESLDMAANSEEAISAAHAT